MLRLALAFLVLALGAALFGMGGLAVSSAGIPQTVFVLLLIVFLVTVILRNAGGRTVV